MKNITNIAKRHKFTVTENQEKSSVIFSLPIGKDKTWKVVVSFDGTSVGLVKAMRAKLDSFPSNNGKYEKFIDLYWDLWEVFGEDADEGTPVGMLTADIIFSNLV